MSNRTNHTIKNVIWHSIQVISMSLMPFFVRTVMMRCWGIEYVGLNSLFMSILNVLNITELGIGETLVYNMYAPAAKKNNDLMCKLLSLYNSLYIFLGIIIFVIGIILVPFLPRLIQGTYPSEINIVLVYFIFLAQTISGYLIFAYASAAFLANQDTSIQSRTATVVWTISYAIQIVIILSIKNYYVYALVLPLASSIVALVSAYFMYKKFPEYKQVKISKNSFSKKFWTEFIKRVIGASVNKLRIACRITVDTLILSSFKGLVPVAVYNNYSMVMQVPKMLLGAVCSGILPSLGNGVALEDKEKNYNVKQQVSFIIHFLATVASSLILVYYQGFMRIWAGYDNTASDMVAILFTILLYILSLEQVNAIVRSSTGIWWQGKWVAIVETIVNIILNIVFLSIWGIEGVIFATIISVAVVNIPFETFYLYKYYYEKKPWKDYLMIVYDALIAFVAVALSYIITRFLNYGYIITFILWGIVATIVPSIVMLICHMRDKRMLEVYRLIRRIIFHH